MPTTEQRLDGRLLRYELAAVLEASGRVLSGRSSKVISDALRREVGHGRVVRQGRGRYAAGAIPPGTVRWMRHVLDRFERCPPWPPSTAEPTPPDC